MPGRPRVFPGLSILFPGLLVRPGSSTSSVTAAFTRPPRGCTAGLRPTYFQVQFRIGLLGSIK